MIQHKLKSGMSLKILNSFVKLLFFLHRLFLENMLIRHISSSIINHSPQNSILSSRWNIVMLRFSFSLLRLYKDISLFQTLQAIMDQFPRFTDDTTKFFMIQLCFILIYLRICCILSFILVQGLSELHRVGIIHRCVISSLFYHKPL